MGLIGEQARRFWMWARRGRLQRELDEELRLHLELRAREQRAQGLGDDEARDAARRAFGNATLIREESRAAWGWRWLDELGQDLRYALRMMRRSPGFTLVAVLAMALGIGANTAIFSVVDGVLLRPLPYADADRLVTILRGGDAPVAPANYRDWKAQTTAFSAMGAAEYRNFNLSGIERPEQVTGLRVTFDTLPLLGVAPLYGRLFTPDEEQAGKDHVVVLGNEIWRTRFGGDPAMVGRAITLDGESYTVVGVMPPGFQFAPFWATRAKLWAPLAFGERAAVYDSRSLRLFARLRDGVTLAQARAELDAVTARIEREHPGTNRDITVTPLLDKVVSGVRGALLVLLGAVGFVLLVACANIAHMLLARAAARQREIALRTALGAGRGRLVRQFLTESILLALLGAAAGILLAKVGIDALVAMAPRSIPRVATVAIHGRVLLVMLAVAVAAGVTFGLVPALGVPGRNLQAGSSRATEAGARGRLRGLLVASQVALALVLTTGAGLMTRSFIALRGVDPGFRADGLLSMVVSVAGTKQAAPGRRVAFYDELRERIAAVPGIESATLVNHLPLGGDIWGRSIEVEGRPAGKPGESENAVYRAVMPGYFRTIGATLLRGRDVGDADRLGAPPVVVVNEKLAARLWPGEDPLGKRIALEGDGWMTVVGVVADLAQNGWANARQPEMFLALRQVRHYLEGMQSHDEYVTVVARARGDALALGAPIRRVIASLDPDVAVADVTTMNDVVGEVTARPRFLLLVLAVFAGVAVLLAAVGVYGVMSHAVSRRTQEIGIRVALGATRADVVRLVARRELGFALAGVVAGIVLSLGLSRLLASLLYGVRPIDPVTFVVVPLILCAVAVAASFVPARRATRVDPMLALRSD